ncbi:MAG: FIST N-terminal domain-containing protein [bacterium]|nr:FIST N-terminal domain-containing protein [bacterium]MDZ4285157.1 FIST N-terminal domain-containing protein [Patescibacteria group bacterium]
MSIHAGVGLSKIEDAHEAGVEATKEALATAGIDRADALLVFSSVALNQEELVRGISEVGGTALVFGCSAAGEITNAGPSQKSVAVMAIQSDTIHFAASLGKNIKASAREAGRAVAESVRKAAKEPLRSFIMLPDVLAGNGAETVRGVLDVLGEHFPVVGGAPGDDFLFKKTYQYLNDEVADGAVAGLGLSGKFSMGIGVRHGWMPIGMPMKVTKADGAVLHELDGRPAISIYEDYFGERAKELRKEALARMAITYPIGLKIPEYEDEYLIRDPITVDEKGAITCAAEVPEGSEVRLMIGSREKAIEAAKDAAAHMMHEFEIEKSKPKFVLMFNCIAREKLYGTRANEEIQAVLDVIGRTTPLLGFYTYGEQAPLGGELRNHEKISSRFYNETMVLFGVGE